jgi:adenylate cyclase
MRKETELPQKPSIAVLPFLNMSGDPEQEYFSDGMTEDLITDLSKISGLFVIARNSTFTYKGKSVKVDVVGRELGVRYVLEGSVRKAENRVRITAQLIEVHTGGHLWAERYDRDLKDIFSLQDEVTQKIVTALAVKLTEDEQERLVHKETDDLGAYDYILRGLEYCLSHNQRGKCAGATNV